MATTPEQRARWIRPLTGTATDQSVVRLYELDLTGIQSAFTGANGPLVRYHDGEGGGTIRFNAHDYSPWPLRAQGFEWNTQGTLPRPTLTVSNIGSIVSALCREYRDCVGAVVTVRHTFAAYLTLPAGSEPSNKELTPMVFTVERKTAENNTICSFDLASPYDAEGVVLPRRQVLATACPWLYRGVECTYPAPTAGGKGWPVGNRLGKYFPGAFTDGLVSADGTQLASNTASFHTTPSHLSDVGKLISGANFVSGTKVAAVVSAMVVNLTVKAIPGSSVHFNINRTAGRLPNGDSGMPLAWSATTAYSFNDTAYVMVKGVRVYAVSKVAGVASNLNHQVYDENYWRLDVCLKKQTDCEDHFGADSQLPYGGMPGANKLS